MRMDTYHAEETDQMEMARYRHMSRLTSMSRLGDSACQLPQYGAPRETMSERGRRYDIDDRTSRDLEAAADAILRAAGDDVHRVDVIDRWTYRPEVAPDRVAYRGAVRYRPHACHRSERIVTGPRTIARADGRLITRKGTERLLIDSGTPGTEVLVTLARTSITLPSGARLHLFGCVGRGWHGRRVVVMPKVTRRDETGRHRAAQLDWLAKCMLSGGESIIGRPKVSTWAAAPTSIAARWKKATDEQNARAIAYRTSLVADGTLVLDSGAVLIIDGQSSTSEATTDRTRVRVLIDDRPTDRGYSLLDVVRRAVLAG